jgi:uncharacterized membrane protein YfcA
MLFGGSLVQSLIGFGMGMVTIPFLVWFGLPLDLAIGLLIPSVFFQTLFNCWQNRYDLPWREVAIPYVLRVAFLPLGIMILDTVLVSRKDLAQQVVGVGLITVVIAQLSLAREAGSAISRWWVVPAGGISGLLAGLVGMGGPALVVWLIHQQWDARKQRMFLWLSLLLFAPVQGALMTYRFGPAMGNVFFWGATMIPSVILGAWVGNRFGSCMNAKRLKTVMHLLLVLIALRMVAAPWINTNERRGRAGQAFLPVSSFAHSQPTEVLALTPALSHSRPRFPWGRVRAHFAGSRLLSHHNADRHE